MAPVAMKYKPDLENALGLRVFAKIEGAPEPTTSSHSWLFAMAATSPQATWLTLGYIIVMVALQGADYLVTGHRDTPSNQAMTLLSHHHNFVRPFFVTALAIESRPRQS